MPAPTLFITGHRGMVGGAIVRALQARGEYDLVVRTREEVDLIDQPAVERFFAEVRPDVVIFAAGKVGGIYANKTYPAEFIYQNLAMGMNVIHAAWRHGTSRLLYLGSTCVYPRLAPQPLREESLVTGELEPTNEAYAVAKIANLKLCQYYRRQYGVTFHSAMPTNLYGPGDNYHPENAHALPALLRRFHEATEQNEESVTIWGTGTPLREYLHVDDLADAVLHLLRVDDPPDVVNVGTEQEISILEVARLIAQTVGYTGKIVTDPTKPDGTPRKLTDSSRIRATGWTPKIDLEEGLKRTYAAFLSERDSGVLRESS